MTVQYPYTLKYDHIWFTRINVHNPSNLWTVSIHWPCESKHYVLFATWFSFREFLNLNFPNWQLHFWNCNWPPWDFHSVHHNLQNVVTGCVGTVQESEECVKFLIQREAWLYWFVRWQTCQAIQVPGFYPRQFSGEEQPMLGALCHVRNWIVFRTPCSHF